MTDRNAAPPAQDTCPLCGGPNGCGLVAGADTCWCFTASIPPAALARVPDAARDRSCICPACAGQACASQAGAGQTGAAPASPAES